MIKSDDTPLVSVIVPTYNRAALVYAAVESVLRQSYRNFEVVVVDDGSSDGTEAELGKFGNAIRYFRQDNRGVNAARNTAIARSNGQLLAFLDDDDLWQPFKLQLQVDLLHQHPDRGLIFSDFSILRDAGVVAVSGIRTWHAQQHDWGAIYEKRHVFKPPESAVYGADLPPAIDVFDGDIYRHSLTEPYVLPTTAIIRRECFDALGGLNETDPSCGDWEYFSRLSARFGCLYVDWPTAFNRSHEGETRLTRVKQELQLQRRIAMISRLWAADPDHMRQYGPQVNGHQTDLLVRLARLHLLGAKRSEAQKVLRAARQLRSLHGPHERMLGLLAATPGMGHVLRGVRRVLHTFAG
jgi:glycosyltransferase involved in cell wall biosynthesis